MPSTTRSYYVPRKPVGFRIDEDLLARVDAEAEVRGQSRTVFVERALEAALTPGSPKPSRVPSGGSSGPISETKSPAAFNAKAAAMERQARLNKGKL
jgi:hypothetical protein